MKLGVIVILGLSGQLLCSVTAQTTMTTTTTTTSSSTPGSPAETQSPVTFIKQEPVIAHKANLIDDLVKHLTSSVSEEGTVAESAEVAKTTSDEAVAVGGDDEAHQNVRIQELLKGILADEFGSEEDDEEDLEDFDSDEPDVFHEDAGNSADDSDVDDDEESFTTTEAPDGTVTTQANQVEEEDNDDEKKTTTVEAGSPAPSERSSRAEESSTKGKSSRKVNRRKGGNNGGGKKNKKNKRKNGKKNAKQSAMARYNRYVDAVFNRMNTLIRNKRMDPLRVNLYAGSSNNGGSKTNPKRSSGQAKQPFPGKNKGRPGNNNKFQKKNKNNGGRRGNNKKRTGGHGSRIHVDHPYEFEQIHREERQDDMSEEENMDNKMRPSSLEALGFNRTTTSTTTSAPEEASTTGSESKEMKAPGSGSGNNSNRPTRGILRGLSTLRRQGQVKVIRKSPHVRVLRSEFSLGPVALDIMQKTANSSKPETTATATAQKLRGVLEIRLKNSGPTRIRRLRVFPPKNVEVMGEKNGLKNKGYRKITPVAAKRLMSVANQVIRQSDQNRARPGKHNKKNNKNNRHRPATVPQKRPGQSPKRNNNNSIRRNNNRHGSHGIRRKFPRTNGAEVQEEEQQ